MVYAIEDPQHPVRFSDMLKGATPSPQYWKMDKLNEVALIWIL